MSVKPATRLRRGAGRSSAGGPAARGSSANAEAGIERIAQRVADQVEGEDGEADGQSGEDGQPRRALGELEAAAAQHQPPRGRRLGDAEAEEAERRFEQDGL